MIPRYLERTVDIGQAVHGPGLVACQRDPAEEGELAGPREEVNELLLLLSQVKPGIKLYIIGRKVELISMNYIDTEFVEPMSHTMLPLFFRDKHFVIKGPAYDSFSLFVVGGMICRVIPIVNETIGIKDFINNEINGFIYDSESTDDLANLLNRILDKKYNLLEVSANAKRIYEELNWNKVANKYMQAYQSIL